MSVTPLYYSAGFIYLGSVCGSYYSYNDSGAGGYGGPFRQMNVSTYGLNLAISSGDGITYTAAPSITRTPDNYSDVNPYSCYGGSYCYGYEQTYNNYYGSAYDDGH